VEEKLLEVVKLDLKTRFRLTGGVNKGSRGRRRERKLRIATTEGSFGDSDLPIRAISGFNRSNFSSGGRKRNDYRRKLDSPNSGLHSEDVLDKDKYQEVLVYVGSDNSEVKQAFCEWLESRYILTLASLTLSRHCI